jgi:hypothetical protein
LEKYNMKRFSIFSLNIIAALLISACGAGQPTVPALSGEDIQLTAEAAAFTIVAQTQAAIPTNTPLPPSATASPTPLPSDTPEPSPTPDAALASPTLAPTQQASGDPCNAPLGGNLSGRDTIIRLVNNTRGDLVVSLYLNKTAFGECGYRGYNLGPRDSTTISDLPQGCYNVGVFVTGPNKNTKAFGYGCINNSDKWTFQIYEEQVILNSP